MTAHRIVAIGLLVSAIAVGLAAHDAPVPRRASDPSAVLTVSLDPSMLQFRSGGQLLGFTPRRVYAAGPGSALIEEFVGAHAVQPVASGRGQAAETGGAPPLQAVTYAQLWDGITVTYEAAPAGFAQTTYRVDPHADPGRIRIRYNTDVALDADGSLRVASPSARGYVSLSAPRAWQDVDGRRIPVRVDFTRPDARVVGFTVGAYDRAHPLVIDPTYAWHTFQGSAGNDYGYGIAVDGGGNVYVAGVSSATWGTPLHAHSGGDDIVVMKFDAAGTLQWHTFYGSSDADRGTGIAVDGSGHAYVTGASSATWGAPLHSFGGYDDIVVLKLDGAGAYQWHTFYGAGTWDYADGITVDAAGGVLVTGTSWDSWDTPVDPHGTNGWDLVVLKLDTDGAYQWHTFAGANQWNYGYAIAADDEGQVYVTGRATGTWGTPLHPFSGGQDIAVLALDAAGAYRWHTFYGAAASNSEGRGVAVDDDGYVYVSGTSTLPWGTPLHAHSGSSDFVVLKLDGAGTYQWHTFYGSTSHDSGRGITVDSSGHVVVTGASWSTWGTPLHPISAYGWDLAVFALDSAGAYLWNTFYGSSASYGSAYGDVGFGIARDTTGNIYVAGASDANWGTPLHAHSGGIDIVVLKLLEWGFSFIDVVNAPLNTMQASNVIAVAGIGAPASIAVSGDASSEYAINGGAWTSAPGTVSDGQTVQVRHVSAATHLASVDTTLTIGAVSDTFTSTTVAEDTTPEPFTFADVADVPVGSSQTSNAITVTGITAAAPIAVSGAASSEYAIGGGAWTSAPGTVTNGQTVRVRHTSAAAFGTAAHTSLSIGGVSDTFTSTTEAEDTFPEPFSFTAQTGVAPDVLVVSDVVTVAGINSAASVYISGDGPVNEYSIGGGAWTSASGGLVSNGQTVQVRQRSSATGGTRRRLWFSVGGRVAAFDVTTGDDTVPNTFTFVDVSNVLLSTPQVSNTITVTGLTTPAPIAVSGDASSQYAIGAGAWTNAPGTVANGQTVRVRHTSSAANGSAVHTTLTIGGVSDTFTSVTHFDITPNPFTFEDVVDVLPGTSQVSNTVLVTGINGPSPIRVFEDASSQYSINGGAWTSAPGTVANGQTVRVRHTSGAGLNLAVHTRLVIGDVSDTFTSTTVPRMVMPVTGLEVWRSSGLGFTLRWRPPTAGLAPDYYVVTGGLLGWDGTRGPALGVLTTDVPIASFDHLGYPGVDLWVHVLAHRTSNGSSFPTEVIVHRWSRPAPSTPTDLLALVNGSTLDLTWRNTFSGGLPNQLVLDVTGARTGSFPLGNTESFRFSGVPPGDYVLRLRAVNGSGSSPASAPVTVRFPDRCSGPPLPPTAFLAYRVGRRLFVVWQSAASGPAATSYRVRVAGAYNGSVDTTDRWLDGLVSPGTYGLRVQAINECGVSEPTAVQSVVVP